ncbi:MAG: hypothetical protein M0R73_03315 [Dehalococcoidia bacterium]|nr:hypothetical protein [Dehalococcoidia bacterium]
MGCPIHIWVPLMGAAAPFARVAHHRVRALFGASTAAEAEAPREMKRWAPVGQPPADSTGSTS